VKDTLLLGGITAFFVVLITMPSLIKVAKMKHLVDEPDSARKLHRSSVPTIGGIIIFSSIIFSFSLWFPVSHYDNQESLWSLKALVSSLVLLFFIGVKDDIIGTAPLKKLLANLVAAFIVVIVAEIKITSMHGLFGIHQLPNWASVLLSLYVYIVIINAYNLIDGIDGLAGGVGCINAVFFGVWFMYVGNEPMALLSFVLAGSLLGFLVFNFSPARVFMGDSGALTIGSVISILAIRLINHPTESLPEFLSGVPTPIFTMVVLVYPLIDTLRVFVVRVIKGQSPFSADNNHIHHRLLKLGLNHRRTVLVIYLFNVVIVLLSFFINFGNLTLGFIILFSIALLLILTPYLFKEKNSN